MKLRTEGRSKTVLVMSLLLAGLGLAWAMPQNTPDELGNCVLDSRALMVDGVAKMEAQVYWDEYKDTALQRYGTRFIIHVPADEHLEIQNYRGDSLVVMWRAKEYEVLLYWDNVVGEGRQIIKVDGVEQPTLAGWTRSSGTFDALTPFIQPVYASMVPSAEGLDRVRFASVNRGIKTEFCLESR